ncbi:MAG: type II secretion system secretin GspD [Rhizobiales bacterium]|nr:type II secretion system secretin GspD [Hyphomicrobiales bacterium]
MLAACNNLIPDNAQKASPNILDQTQSIDLLPRFPEPSGPATANRSKDFRGVVYNGAADRADSTPVVTLEGAEPSASGDGYDLNFENAPVTTVAKVILGDILGTGYIIDPRVQGTVTLTSGRPVPKSEVLYVLESALRVSNVALVRESNGYRLVPGNEAVANGRLDVVTANSGRPQAGYGISVVPVRFVSAATLIKLLDSFATKPGAVRVDTARNMLLIQGTGPERRSAVETVLNFDTDWMRGQTVGIFPVRHSAPEPIIFEVEKIMDSGDGGISQSLVKMQPIARLNAILVVTSKPALLKTAETWIRRLDNSEISTTGVKVYRVRYGDARNIAQILNEMFKGGSAGTIDTASSQIAPEGGVMTTTSGPVAAGPVGPPMPTPVARLTGGSTANRQPASENQLTGGGSRALSNPRGASARDTIMPGVRITADVTNNSLLIYANEEDYRVIEGALRQIDRPQLQVAFDATIAEVTLNDSLTYGVQFFLKSTNVGAPPDTGSAVNTIKDAVLSRVLPGFNILIGSEKTPQAVIDALHGVTDVKILSNPSLVVIDNGVATLQVGDQVPITTGTATVLTSNNAIVNTINYQNTGIILRVVPRVSFNNTVRLDIEQEISNVSNSSATGTLTPTISQRKVKSILTVADGQTVLLAGLISETQNKSRNGIPVLDQLPGYLGDVFSHQNKTAQRTELIIFIRPQIIRDSVDAHLVAEALRAKLKARVGTVSPRFPQGSSQPISVR